MGDDKHPVMGELLLREGILTEGQLAKALEAQKSSGGRLGYHLIRLGYVNVQRLSQFMRDSMGLIPYDLAQWVKDPTVIDLIPGNLAQFYQVVPVEKNGAVLTVAIADLDNPSIIPALEELTGLTIDPVVCPRETVIQALEQFYGVAKDPGVVRNLAGDHLFVLALAGKRIRPIHWSALKPDSSAAEWLRTVLAEAIRTGSRTMYIKPDEHALRIAFKGADNVEDRFALAPQKRQEMDALLIELARLKDRRSSPRQEGRVRLQVEGRFLTLHVKQLSTLQGNRYALTLYDEKVLARDWQRIVEQLLPSERGGPPGQPSPGPTASCSSPARPARASARSTTPSSGGWRGPSGPPWPWRSTRCWPWRAPRRWRCPASATRPGPSSSRWPSSRSRPSSPSSPSASGVPWSWRSSPPPTRACSASSTSRTRSRRSRWLLRNQFRSPLKAGVLKGILTVASLTQLCPHCKLPYEVASKDGSTHSLFTRQGCEHCLRWETLPTTEALEWLPLNETVRGLLADEPRPEDLSRAVREAGGLPMGQRVLTLAKEGLVDAQDAREYLS